MHKHFTLNLTSRQSTLETVNELNDLWNKIGIPTAASRNSIRKFEKFYEEYKLIKKQKSTNNKSINQTQKANDFINQLSRIFDIANNNEISNISSDLQLFLMECRQNDDLSQKLSQFSMSNAGSSQSSNHTDKRFLSDYEDELPQAKKKRKADIMTEILVAALDRTKTKIAIFCPPAGKWQLSGRCAKQSCHIPATSSRKIVYTPWPVKSKASDHMFVNLGFASANNYM
ncbi:Protein of unknown function [Cotesia congregata]|uniref:Uncharacterized protein n=1 Tax=Cotesia congregata TaxID=51543 RepID=A0A8J2HK87_COTCN|nr:Protein of unknown function [Cotesia congregata]